MPDQPVRRVGRRRVRTDAAPGSDATPQAPVPGRPDAAAALAAEDTDRAWGGTASVAPSQGDTANDQRLKADKPPHW